MKSLLTISSDMTHPKLHKLLTAGLYEMNWFENGWINTIGPLSRSDHFTDLGASLKRERACSQEHVNRIRRILISLGEPLKSVQSKVISELIEDLAACCSLVSKSGTENGATLMLAIIKSANYKVGVYSGILELATAMQFDYVEGLLKDTICEEKQSISLFTQQLANQITVVDA